MDSWLINLTMNKAYDRIEWSFLRAILCKMGCSEWWVHLVLQCVITVSYSIVHGKNEMGPIVTTRGIRHGDPLSPYLFIICANGLSAMIQNYESKQSLTAVKNISKSTSNFTYVLHIRQLYIL